jgi:aminoglycoside phosphotransferase (APT) family kinase protein
VTSGQWRPVPAAGSGTDASADADKVLRALSGALDASAGHDWNLSIERERFAGRSNMYIVRAETPVGSSSRWVVKQPHAGWTQDDVGSPLTAQEEFLALQRLYAHFTALNTRFRVPTPVAYLPELDAFAMEYVAGVDIKQLLSYRSVVRPRDLLAGLTAAGTFLRHLHALEVLPTVNVDLRQEAEKVLAVAEEKLHPLGLSLPEQVRRTMAEFPAVKVSSPQVWLHGDFGPANILLEDDGSTVGLDAALQTVGLPEDDLVRFVALVSGVIRLAPEIVAPPVARIRHELESRLLRTYYQTPTWPPLFELRYLHQLARRWCRLRELAQQHERNALLPARLRVIGRQMRLLMLDSERRLVSSLGR